LGATLNLAVLLWLADRRGWMRADGVLARAVGAAGGASAALAGYILLAEPVARTSLGPELRLVLHGVCGALIYGGVALGLGKLMGLDMRRMRLRP
jgi:putative peptidoglycan lipid II flippase